jgi:hypothetical protein
MDKIYSFWNGKNLEGTQEHFEIGGEPECSGCGFRCVTGSETISADDL